MKLPFGLILSLLLFLVLNLPGQDIKTTDDGIAAAIRQGNAPALSARFNNTVDISVPGKEGTFSLTQAELLMKDFFRNHKVAAYEVKHSGSSRQDSHYCIGALQAGGKTFRVYYLLRPVEGKYLIQMFKVSEE